jgi:hypothetical protein
MYTTHWCHLEIHLLKYAHISEHMETQDVVQDVIGSIGWEVNFQVVHDTTSHVSFIHATNILLTESYPKTSSYFSWHHHHGSHTHQPFISNDFNTRVCNFVRWPKWKKIITKLTPTKPIQALSNRIFWLFTKTSWWIFCMLMPATHWSWKPRGCICFLRINLDSFKFF